MTQIILLYLIYGNANCFPGKIFFKGTVSVILSDLSCKDGKTRFTMVPFKLCRIKYKSISIIMITDFIFNCCFYAKL